MTLSEVRDIVLACDPGAKHYGTTVRGNYTTWHEYQRSPVTADGLHDFGWRFQIDRYTKMENDPTAATIEAALSGMENVAYSYMVDYDPDSEYIHHIFDCEAI